jgi:hypothetical protein
LGKGDEEEREGEEKRKGRRKKRMREERKVLGLRQRVVVGECCI